MEYLYIKDWAEWQSYRKDRGAPPWLKVHRSLMSNHKWSALSDAEKGQLISIWIIAADNDGKVPANSKVLRKICQLDDEPNISLFKELGLLTENVPPDVDANLTSTCQPSDAPEKSRGEKSRGEKSRGEKSRGEEKTTTSVVVKKNNSTQPSANELTTSPEAIVVIDGLGLEKSKCLAKAFKYLEWRKEKGYAAASVCHHEFRMWLTNDADKLKPDIPKNDPQTYTPKPPERIVTEREQIANLARMRDKHGEGHMNFPEIDKLAAWEKIHGKAQWETIDGINYLKNGENNA